ncbi:hypothetical protein HaLaN_22984, partial [Haematococcus lacustris]
MLCCAPGELLPVAPGVPARRERLAQRRWARKVASLIQAFDQWQADVSEGCAHLHEGLPPSQIPQPGYASQGGVSGCLALPWSPLPHSSHLAGWP